jgi:Domain of unknown function (DUF427)
VEAPLADGGVGRDFELGLVRGMVRYVRVGQASVLLIEGEAGTGKSRLVQIFDTTRARYVWEWPYYPQYYIPAEDIDPRSLVDEHHEQRLRQGTTRRHGLRAGGLDRPG